MHLWLAKRQTAWLIDLMFRACPCLALEQLTWIRRRKRAKMKRSKSAMMTFILPVKVIAGTITPRISYSCWEREQLDGAVCPQSGLSVRWGCRHTGHPLLVLSKEAFVSTKQIGQRYCKGGHPMSITTYVSMFVGEIFRDWESRGDEEREEMEAGWERRRKGESGRDREKEK